MKHPNNTRSCDACDTFSYVTTTLPCTIHRQVRAGEIETLEEVDICSTCFMQGRIADAAIRVSMRRGKKENQHAG